MAQQQMNVAQIRQAIFAQDFLRSQELPYKSFDVTTSNQVVQFDLPKAGIGLWARVTIRGTVKRTEGASVGTVTPSPLWPFNLVQKVNFQDYTGIMRVSSSAYGLYIREISQRSRYGYDPTNPLQPVTSYASDLYTATVPAGTASTTTTSTLNFSFEVPFSLHKKTTVGTYPFSVPTGSSTLQISLSPATGSTLDYPFSVSGGSVMEITGNIYVTYYYLDPPVGMPLPTADFSLVHELNEVQQTDNLSAGATKLFTLDTGRTYYGLYHLLVSNNAPDTMDVDKIQFIVNGDTPRLDENRWSYLERKRQELGRDLPPGVFIFDFMQGPWTPDSYGSLQTALRLGSGFTNTGTTYLRVLKESLYQAIPA